MPAERRARRGVRLLASGGSVLAGLAVALSAYAAHGAEGLAQQRLLQAAAFAFAHGLALAVLAPQAGRRLGLFALAGMLLGCLLFSGSLVGAALSGWPTKLAPFGGTLMIAAWFAWAIDALWR